MRGNNLTKVHPSDCKRKFRHYYAFFCVFTTDAAAIYTMRNMIHYGEVGGAKTSDFQNNANNYSSFYLIK